jgi:ABC-type dipeptide/oligopeptide/nickel transport system ATPase component
MSRNIAVSPTERGVIVGMTGSGKTVLAKQLLQCARSHVVVYDAKGLIHWPGYARYTSLRELTTLNKRDVENRPRIIYAPNHFELDNPEVIDAFFSWIYNRKNTTLYVDEVYSVVRGESIPHYYNAVLTRGRELGISTISSTQRPKKIPQVVLSESENYYVFRLQLPQDRQRVREIVALSNERMLALNKHEFFFGSADGDIIGPMKLTLNK